MEDNAVNRSTEESAEHTLISIEVVLIVVFILNLFDGMSLA